MDCLGRESAAKRKRRVLSPTLKVNFFTTLPEEFSFWKVLKSGHCFQPVAVIAGGSDLKSVRYFIIPLRGLDALAYKRFCMRPAW